MTTNDLNHILQLQKDLWRWPKSRSAVMIGAGFSLNSKPLPGVASSFPTWNQLVRKMFDELYPLETDISNEEREYRNQKFQSENYLRLASKYEAAFGYARLDALIRNLNPDNDHLPGALHQKLLELPWNDVFTTNYDTLLERTKVLDRTYHTVAHPSELPGALAPRIVKLHGSFTNTHRLVIAEEHYRTYPKDSAPFVNTVQQSLLENSFVLLGFSGDDPNFLAWTGWIRDELQDRHSSIYLVGPLDLSTTDRLLLKKRGVTPIDLYPMFDRNEHYESILWFLESLSIAAPQRPENWLNKPAKKIFLSNRPLVGDIHHLSPESPELKLEAEKIPLSTIPKLFRLWAHERLSYPGWVIAPEEKRHTMWRSTRQWLLPLHKTLSDLTATDRMLCAEELIWRLNISMVPLDQEIIKTYSKDLINFYNDQIKSNFKTLPINSEIFGYISSARILNTWIELCLETMREAREMYEDTRWNELSTMLGEVLSANQIKSDRYTYETLLRSAWNIQLTASTSELSAWQPSNNVPIAQLWKSSLLAEVGKLDESRALLMLALNNIRKSAKNKSNNIELLSLEGWCTFLIYQVERCIKDPQFEISDFSQRWQELKLWDCNPVQIRTALEQTLDGLTVHQTSNKQTSKQGFDPRTVSTSWSFSGGMESVNPAFSYLRHFEQAGIPMYLSFINITGKRLEKALQLMQPYLGFWSPALMVRARQIKQLTDNTEILSRTQVAAMDDEMARRIHAWGMTIFECQVNRYYQSTHQKILRDKLVVGIPELLSRISFKLSAEDLTHSFNVVLRMYSALSNVSAPGMTTTFNTWLNRIYQAADDQQLLEWLPELLKVPFREVVVNTARYRDGWIDPMNSFPNRLSLRNTPNISSDISSSITWLFAKIHSLTDDSRSSAIWRLATLNSANLLNKEHIKQFKDLLWMGVDKNSLPTDLHAFNYLHLPKRNERIFFDLFKKHLITQPFESSLIETDGKLTLHSRYEFPSSRLKTIAMSSKPILQLPGEMVGLVTWTPHEAMELFEELAAWWETVKVGSTRFETIQKPGGRWFGSFIARVIGTNIEHFPEIFVEKVFQWVIALREFNIYATSALPPFYHSMPTTQHKIKELLIEDISSTDENKVTAAASAIHSLYAFSQAQEKEIDREILIRLIHRVAFRSEVAILDVIEQLTYLLIQHPNSTTETDIKFLCDSLTEWARAIQLATAEATSGFPVAMRPDLQTAIGTLAGTLSTWMSKNKGAFKKHSAIDLWRENGIESCLPEVRRAFANGAQYALKKNQ